MIFDGVDVVGIIGWMGCDFWFLVVVCCWMIGCLVGDYCVIVYWILSGFGYGVCFGYVIWVFVVGLCGWFFGSCVVFGGLCL